MDLGEQLTVIANGQYELFVSAMNGHGVPPTLALFILDSMKLQLLESIRISGLVQTAKANLEPKKEESHTGTIADLKGAMEHGASCKT